MQLQAILKRLQHNRFIAVVESWNNHLVARPEVDEMMFAIYPKFSRPYNVRERFLLHKNQTGRFL